MTRVALALALLFPSLAAGSDPAAVDEWLDGTRERLTVSTSDGSVRARVSGSLDLEGYYPSEPVSDLLFTEREFLFAPRLILFLDAQLGRRVYFFAQARGDRGFDPADQHLRARLDEYALRFTPWHDGRLNVQLGQFATVVGNWGARHLSWDNPFITAPLPYDNLTGMWDGEAVRSVDTLLRWAHVIPNPFGVTLAGDKDQRLPIIWGPNYASGIALSGALGKFEYAIECKNTALSSRPGAWSVTETQWEHPTFSGRLGYRPNEAWNLGVSASTGTYLRPDAASTLADGRGLGDYRQIVVGHDVSFAWRHWQLWAEAYAARFEIPHIGDADTFAYYIEAKYKFTPQLFGALRWNQQWFSRLTDVTGQRVTWGRNVWRIDVAPTYRLSAHMHVKLQFSLRHEESAPRDFTRSVAAQFTTRF